MCLVTRFVPVCFSGRVCALWLLCGLLALLLVNCQPRLQPPQAPSTLEEPRFLPTLPPPRSAVQPGEPRSAFAAAEALRMSRQYLQARQAFSQFVQRYPESRLTDDALLALGHIALTLEQYAQAIPPYRTLLERFPGSERVADAQLGLGIALYHDKDYPQSLATARQALMRIPSGPNQGLAHYYAGVAALKLQQYVEGITALKTATTSSTDPALTKKAQEFMTSTIRERLTVDMLRTLAQQYATEYPGALLLERLAQEYRKTGNLAAEAEALQRFTTAFPQEPGAQEARTRLQAVRAQLPPEGMKIGVLFPLSGAGSRAGTRALRGVELALAMLQNHEPGLQLSLAVRDSTQHTEVAREALRSLVQTDRVIGVIGPLLSRMATDLAPLADQFGVPLLSPYARDSDFPALSPYAFRNSLTDAIQGRYLAEYAISTLKLQRFVILHPNDAYGTALRDRFQEQVRQRQGDVVAVIPYDAKSANISRLLGRLKDLQYEAVFLPEYADKVGTIVGQMAAQGVRGIQLLGTDSWNAPTLLANNVRLLEGAVFVDGFFAQASAPLVKTFVEQFQARYRETPDLFAAQAYDTLFMYAQALKTGARTPAQLRDGLLQVRNFAGVSGVTSMGAQRDAEKVPYLLTVKRGQIVQLNPASP